MAIDLRQMTDDEILTPERDESGSLLLDAVKRVLEPFASLKLTVILFALSIVLILAGTFAQVDKDIWEVISLYFRCWMAWIPFSIFFPPSFVPEMPDNPEEVSALGKLGIWGMQSLKGLAVKAGSFPFPGGKTIGIALAANLLAAHLVRFKAQARGAKLFAGIFALALGCGVTWYIIASAGNSRGFQGDPWIPYKTLWIGYQGLLALLCMGAAYLTAHQFLYPTKTNKVLRWFTIGVTGVIAVKLAVLFVIVVAGGAAMRPSDASMRILWQLTQGGTASVALMIGCWIVFGRRAGIVLLHSGVGLLMFYELHVAMTAVETQMHIEEGETTNFTADIRTYELAVVDKSKPGEEQVTVIPRSMIAKDKTIDLPALPFKIEIKDVLTNSHLRAASVSDKNLATTGLGVEWFAEPRTPGAGTDSDSKVDMASAYVSLTDRAANKPIGTWLVGMELANVNETDTIRIGDKTYELALRPKRYYKPYRFRLEDVRKEDYIGTSTPRSYASTVQIDDAARNVCEKKTIWMNNPLRFADETFYQSNYFRERGTGIEHTALSVVTNSGWMMPYVACMLVSIGMLAHFLMMLVRFLTKGDAAEATTGSSRLRERLGMKPASDAPLAAMAPPEKPLGLAGILVPLAFVALAGFYFGAMAMPPAKKTHDYDLYRFGQIPVVQDGRVKPLDSAAYSALLAVSGRPYVEVGHGKEKRKVSATRWMLDIIAETKAAEEYEAFRIENLEVQETIGVRKREGMRYSRAEIRKNEKQLRDQVIRAREASQTDRKSLSVFQRKILELDDKVSTYDNLKFAFGLHHRIGGDTQAEVIQSFQQVMQFEKMLAEQGQPVLAIPPVKEGQKWRTLAGAWLEDVLAAVRDKSDKKSPPVNAWSDMLRTYAEAEEGTDSKVGAQDFNRAVNGYLKELNDQPPADVKMKAMQFEAFFNHFRPFTHADRMYIVAFVLGAMGWLVWTRGFNRTAFWLLLTIFVVHTFAICGRIYISGRPPVTNLYSSAVFIGWGCVALGLILELVFRLGIGNLIASVAGYATLLIADGLSLGGDTFTVLQAVLDTQFWLATHVTTITLGYATTYLAGLLGIVYVVRGLLTPKLTLDEGRAINRMIYGTLCFSIFFSFVGTVLGGLWADDSWGRFWGWDPKENGALIIVLWNALVLHARWGGMVKERGMATLAIAGNIFVSWSWWGVNELGAGLHSYGFTAGTVLRLGLFVISQLLLIGIALIPQRYWWSIRRRTEAVEQLA